MRRAGMVLAGLIFASSAGGCTVLFEPGSGSAPPPPDPCEPLYRVYERGAQLEGPLYERVDYGQGTLTSWVRLSDPLKEATGSIPVIDVGGIAVALDPGGDVQVSIPGAPEVTFPGAAAAWEPGEDQFLALRWDAFRPLTGAASLQAHVDLIVGGEHLYELADAPFDPGPGTSDLAIGDPDQRLLVDQVVVYRRPIYVPDDVLAEDELTEMAQEKHDSAVLAGGPFDVVFATAAPRTASCDEYEVWGWSFPVMQDGLYPGGLMLPDLAGGYFEGAADQALQGDSVYGGALVVSDDASLSRTLQVTPLSSYLLRVVAHPDGDGTAPLVVVHEAGTPDAELLRLQGQSLSSREAPDDLIGTFTVPSDAREITVRLESAAGTGSVYYHRAQLLPDLLANASFEDDSGSADDPFEPPGWTLQHVEEPGESFLQSDPEAHSGLYSLCLSTPESPALVTQEPQQEQLADHEFYAAGAFFLWNPGSTVPEISVGNGSLFEVGLPYSSRDKIGASGRPLEGTWQHLGAVGRRLIAPELNSRNDYVLFGGLRGDEPTDLCVDDAYVLEMERLSGSL